MNGTSLQSTGVGDGTFPTPPRGNLCAGTTKYGRPCPNAPQPDNDVCWHHDPELAERRSRNARAGGRAVHSPVTLEIQELKDELRSLIRKVKEGTMASGPASVITQLSNVLLRAIETERKIRETEDLEERLAALERGRDGAPSKAA